MQYLLTYNDSAHSGALVHNAILACSLTMILTQWGPSAQCHLLTYNDSDTVP